MARNEPTRWVCQTRPEECDGYFCVYGSLRVCPIAEKCMNPNEKYTPLEYGYEKMWRGYRNQYLCVDHNHYLEHARRGSILRRAFLPEECKEKVKAYNYDRYWYGGERERQHREYLKKTGGTITHLSSGFSWSIPPCGGDCVNCPYEECAYPDWEDETTGAQNSQRRSSAKYRAKLKADPVRYAKYLKENSVRKKAHREAIKDDPARYAKYLEKKRAVERARLETIKADSIRYAEFRAKANAKKRIYFEKLKADPVRYAEFRAKENAKRTERKEGKVRE